MGQVRWPFGPPHLTFNPPKKTKNKKENNQKNNKKNKENKRKNKKKTRETKRSQKNSKNTKKLASQLSVKFFFFWVVFQNFPFLTPWPRKRAPKKHYKNRGLRAFLFGKQMCVTKRPFLDQKTKIF